MKKVLALAAAVAIIAVIYFYQKKPGPVKEPTLEEIVVPVEEVPPVIEEVKPEPTPVKKPPPPPPAPVRPPQVKLHEELIPKDIRIVRMYYSQEFVGPKSKIIFDINGSGFTKEFEEMISVKSGQDGVKVKKYAYVTPNQIRGTFVIGKDVPTKAIFPQVLIQDKPVFQASQPFAVIRPGEVLNLVFTEMGASGRSGKFRIFTNLTEKMYRKFKIESSTPNVKVELDKKTLPFIVDSRVNIGPVPTGNYGLRVSLDNKTIWEKKGIIRVVRPNVGQSGLVQRIIPLDRFYRPGDKAVFSVQGSGFRTQDTELLTATVIGMEGEVKPLFTYVARGRMDLTIQIPKKAETKVYGMRISQDDNEILVSPQLFSVVGNNWTRALKVDPPLVPGGKGTLVLIGRDMDKKFVESIKVEVDEPTLKVGPFFLDNPNQAYASISIGPAVSPGDYWLKMSSKNGPVNPQAGSIIKILKKTP